MRFRGALTVAACAIAIAAAGCGSDKGGGSGTLGKADLAKKADAICVKYNAKIKAAGGAPTTQAAFLAFLQKLLPIVEQQGKDLHALTPESAVASEWTGLLGDYDKLLAATKQLESLAKAGDVSAMQELITKEGKLSDASDKKLDAFGAPHCGSQSND